MLHNKSSFYLPNMDAEKCLVNFHIFHGTVAKNTFAQCFNVRKVVSAMYRDGADTPIVRVHTKAS